MSVDDIAPISGYRPAKPPERIYVEGFDAPANAFRVDRSGEDFDRFRSEFSQFLARETMLRINKHILPAELVEKDAVRPGQNAWLIAGRFLRVNQGSRALRMTFGFGAGGSKLETRVVVYDLSGRKPRAFFTFRTTGGSNAQAGAIFNLTYWAAGAAALGHVFSGLSYDAVRTSREVTGVLSEYMAEHGFSNADHALHAKKLGEWP